MQRRSHDRIEVTDDQCDCHTATDYVAKKVEPIFAYGLRFSAAQFGSQVENAERPVDL